MCDFLFIQRPDMIKMPTHWSYMANSQLLKSQVPLFLVLTVRESLLTFRFPLVAAKVREGTRGRAKGLDGKTNLKFFKAPCISRILRRVEETSPTVTGSKHIN